MGLTKNDLYNIIVFTVVCLLTKNPILAIVFTWGFHKGIKRVQNGHEEKIVRNTKEAEFQIWRTNYQSVESSKLDIEKQWMDFDVWKAQFNNEDKLEANRIKNENMVKMEPVNEGNLLINVTRWICGALLLIMCLGELNKHAYIAGVLFLFAAIMVIPPSAKRLENKLRITMSGITRFAAIFVIFIVALAASPNTDNSAVATTPDVQVTEKPTLTQTVVETPIATPTVVETPIATPTVVETPIAKPSVKDANYITDAPTPITNTNTVTSTTVTIMEKDREWLSLLANNLGLISHDLEYFSKITDSTDLDKEALKNAYIKLEQDTKTAYDNSKSYSLSLTFQPVKSKYEFAIYYENQAAYYGRVATEELINGNYEQSEKDSATCGHYLELENTTINEANDMMEKINKAA